MTASYTVNKNVEEVNTIKKYRRGLPVFAAFLLLLAGCVSREASSDKELKVSAAVSLKKSLLEIQQLYSREKPGIRISYNFGASGALQRQIEQGAQVDVFLAAADKQMNSLENQGLLIRETRRELLGNRMVLIVPKSGPEVRDFSGLSSGNIKKIAVGEPSSVPAGQYALEALTSLQLKEKLRDKLVYAKDAKEVLTWVETGNAEAGFVYQSDAKMSQAVRVACLVPETAYTPISYPVAVLRESKLQSEAREFLEFLASHQAKTIFRDNGFVPLQ